MIHYQLRCGAAHEFDAWFLDSRAFEEQAGSGLLECPHCGERQVARALMTPAVPSKRRRAPVPSPATEVPVVAAPAPPPPSAPAPEPPAQVMPDQVRAVLQRLRGEVERRCEYVGDRFAAEARRIHDGETMPRGIYGEASPEQAEALSDDGIDVAQIPWLPRADA